MAHISDCNPKTAENIVDTLDPNRTLEAEDAYHRAILEAAYCLRGKGLTDFTYHTQWSSGTTQWLSPTGNGGLNVSTDGRLS